MLNTPQSIKENTCSPSLLFPKDYMPKNIYFPKSHLFPKFALLILGNKINQGKHYKRGTTCRKIQRTKPKKEQPAWPDRLVWPDCPGQLRSSTLSLGPTG